MKKIVIFSFQCLWYITLLLKRDLKLLLKIKEKTSYASCDDEFITWLSLVFRTSACRHWVQPTWHLETYFCQGKLRPKFDISIPNKLSSNFKKIENLGAVSTEVKKTNIWHQNSSGCFKLQQKRPNANPCLRKIVEKNKQIDHFFLAFQRDPMQ